MWNDDAGDWQGLERLSEQPRYKAIAELVNHFSPDRSLLDVGCGQSVLARYLPEMRYCGIEPSAKACGHAICATAESFATSGRFGCIVFNEVLYYLSDPVAVLTRYADFLVPGGIVVISIYQKPESLRTRLAHLFRHSLSNRACSRKVEKFLRGWEVLADRQVALWRMWVARPHQCALPLLPPEAKVPVSLP